ncbi:MAG: MBL fold metallo-hydrolase [Phycisphaera sp.]|nr:MBL fold metallo-hydrolase [Phycisphaera sp.]
MGMSPSDHRTRILTLLSITATYATLTILDADIDLPPRDPGRGRVVLSIEGTFLDVPRPRFDDPGRRGVGREVSCVGTMRIDSIPGESSLVLPFSQGDEIRVRIIRGPRSVPPGVRIALSGVFTSPGKGLNPGSDRSGRPSGTWSLMVPDGRLIHPTVDANRRVQVDWPVAIRSEIRRSFRRGVDAMSSGRGGDSGEGSLLRCLLTGDRNHLDDQTRSAFTRSGLSHLLAISGLHLAVVASIPWIGLGWLGVGRWIRCATTAVFVLGGVMMVETSPSVIRAAAMIVLVLTGVGIGAVFSAIPVLGIVAGGMLWFDPGWIDSTGFQLSFVATSALACSCRGARESWFGRRDSIGRSRLGILRERWVDLATASIVACLATLPIVESRFGVVPLYLIPASIVIAPILLVFLAIIVPASIMSMVEPAFGDFLSRPILAFDGLIRDFVVGVADASPVILTLDPGIAWTVVATMLGIAAPGLFGNRGVRWIAGSMFFGLVTIPMLPSIGPSFDGRIRVDMLAVGDGTAMLIRTPRSTVLFDAGSSSMPGFGGDLIFRSLRSLGVRRLDGIVVSHANIDHHGAIPALIRLIPTSSIALTPASLRRFHRASEGAAHPSLLESIGDATSLWIVDRPDRLPFPDGEWLVLHPHAADEFRRTNDESMSLRIHGSSSNSEVHDPIADLVLFGDLETEGVIRMMERTPALEARIMELPHHGSWRPVVVDLIEAVRPSLIIQSTGPLRFDSDRFEAASRRRTRLVTCRDGAITAMISRAGSMTVETKRSGIRANVRSP